MSNATRKTTSQSKVVVPGVQRNYSEVVDYLDTHWSTSPKKDVSAIKALDTALGNPSQAVNVIAVAGTNGKGLTVNYASLLLRQENIQAGAFYAPHLLTYNEQIVINNETIANKNFTELANDVINIAETQGIKADSYDILAMIALLYFNEHKVNAALIELHKDSYDPFTITHPSIFAITRITNDVIPAEKRSMEDTIKELLTSVKTGTHVVSADQSKANLQVMLEETNRYGGIWAMPIRKLAPLVYPFEQLHGRCAALAERIAQIFIEHFAKPNNAIVVEKSLLAKQKGQRGRPTLEAKRQAELNPKKTVEQFWRETSGTLPAHFQVLDKEKPTILLDTARNIDALKNLFLGVRLKHYQRPLKGLTFIFGCDKNTMHAEEFLRLLRYFSKKNSAQVIFCPISKSIPGVNEESWDVEKITNDVKGLKIKARSASSFKEAFEFAKDSVDERYGLVVITGSQSIIAEYWHYKGMKKL